MKRKRSSQLRNQSRSRRRQFALSKKKYQDPSEWLLKPIQLTLDLERENKQLKSRIEELELQKEKIVTVEKEASGDLKEAARLLAASEMNKEDLSEGQIFKLLQKSSEEEVKKKIGFWAHHYRHPDKPETTKRYIGKK